MPGLAAHNKYHNEGVARHKVPHREWTKHRKLYKFHGIPWGAMDERTSELEVMMKTGIECLALYDAQGDRHCYLIPVIQFSVNFTMNKLW
jgi:hypothetical protein